MVAVISSVPAIVSSSQAVSSASGSAAAQAGQAATNDNSSFGPAANVTLSPQAQAIAGGPSSSTTTTQPATQPAPPPSAGASSGGGNSGGSAPVPVTSSSSADTTTLVEETKARVAAQVGIVGADEVVDTKGNIAYGKLDQLLRAQDTPSKPLLLQTQA